MFFNLFSAAGIMAKRLKTDQHILEILARSDSEDGDLCLDSKFCNKTLNKLFRVCIIKCRYDNYTEIDRADDESSDVAAETRSSRDILDVEGRDSDVNSPATSVPRASSSESRQGSLSSLSIRVKISNIC